MNKGFTLIETLVAISILGIISVALFSIIPSLYEADRYAIQQTSAVDEARRGIKVMLREIREARSGQDGSYMIEHASGNKLIFYSDIDQDDKTERIRYFLGDVSGSENIQDVVNYDDGGNSLVVFENFTFGQINSAQLQIGVEGDLGSSSEYIDITIDGYNMGRFCDSYNDCQDCAGYFQDIKSFDVIDYILDDRLEIWLDSRYNVNDFCDWQHNNHSFIGNLVLTLVQEVVGSDNQFQKGTIDPTNDLIPEYDLEEEKLSIISNYVQNKIDTPQKNVFYYYDVDGNEIENPQENLEKISLIKLKLIINVNQNIKPNDYYLESKVKLRALQLDDEQ